ncbi:MAG: hypothetical protein ABI543_01135 [Ignavibacteria bacterium]
MLKSKFIDLVKSFSKEELKQFRDFVNSPFHNSNKNVIKLYDIIRKYQPDFSSPLIEKEKLFSRIYPGKKYNDTVIRILLSDLIKLGEDFLILKKTMIDTFGDKLTLLEELKDRGLDSLYLTNHKDTLKKLSAMEDKRTRYFSLFELEVVNVDFYLRRDKQQQIVQNINERSENLIYFMLIEIVRNIHDLIINEKTFNAKYDFSLAYEFMKNFDFKAILEKLKTKRAEHYDIINIYYNLLNALVEENDDKYFDIFKESVENVMKLLTKDDKHHFLQYLETCCLMRMKNNPDKYRKEIFHVYELMMEFGIYSYGTAEMTAQKFKNIFIAAVNIKELKWAENFCSKYIPNVQSEYRDSMQYYSSAILNFLKKDFLKALADLNKVKNDYFILKLDIKSWTLKIYYELEYIEQAQSHIDSYRHFLSKNLSIAPQLKQRHLSYLKFTTDLMRLSANPDKFAAELVLMELSNNNNVVHKDWINEKLTDLKTKWQG